MKVDGAQAWAKVRKNPGLRWARRPEAFSELIYPASYEPKVSISPEDRVFCLGSCFARNVEEHLIYRDVAVLSKQLCNPRSEWAARPNGIVNKFTTQSMLNEVRWLEGGAPDAAALMVEDRSGWIDLQLSSGCVPLRLERTIERREYLTQDYFSRIQQADLVILTLGLNEVWFDRTTDTHLNVAPSVHVVAANPGRFELCITTADENLAALTELRHRLLRLRPGLKFVVSVSPVPLDISFTGEDPVVANSRSKSVLRAAADTFAASYDDVDYFPSYEMITMAPRALAFAPDCRHVADRAVSAVIDRFLQAHGWSGPEVHFNEMAYLAANPDVDVAVRDGNLISGYHHWKKWGRDRGRPLAPATPTPHMIKAGAV